MSLPPYHGPRVKLVLGTARVLRITKATVGFDIHVEFANRSLTFHGVPAYVDAHEGDLLSLYTEVALAEPSEPSVQ